MYCPRNNIFNFYIFDINFVYKKYYTQGMAFKGV
ncbi:unnamed protein product [Commensalibacter communis]|uniref:Uncharacterized protein n=1 Tax=Commensalibacter communis TaxID=2972786 RepID=A0A9W4X6H1_9PROT|nr:unnamed protein product [Commensalibacter communis]CAI3926755.1 unnamed protein product [Commensalibacter communis]CAI3934653.1 unnamed protein product [Commensalibacter communis]CAI3936255.1 unnamed protein product [Commensalibacter communis]CAI3938854.1 unnamed protein product [Commensalibacter communis]